MTLDEENEQLSSALEEALALVAHLERSIETYQKQAEQNRRDAQAERMKSGRLQTELEILKMERSHSTIKPYYGGADEEVGRRYWERQMKAIETTYDPYSYIYNPYDKRKAKL